MSKSQPKPPGHDGHRNPGRAPDKPAKQERGKAASADKDAEKRHLDEQLEEALEESFPASDPPAPTAPVKHATGKRKGKPPRHTKY